MCLHDTYEQAALITSNFAKHPRVGGLSDTLPQIMPGTITVNQIATHNNAAKNTSWVPNMPTAWNSLIGLSPFTVTCFPPRNQNIAEQGHAAEPIPR